MDTETIEIPSRDGYATRYQLLRSDGAHGGNRVEYKSQRVDPG